jgi:PTH1 family peptidyl-tRNA hydrolase
MKLIVGLGNPGLKYRNTRHNVGFLAVDSFAKQNKVIVDKKAFGALFARKGEAVFLKPHTFMNSSGRAVLAAASKFGIAPQDILTVCDDIDLPLGTLRLRAQGSAGGHKGLISIIENLQTSSFNRLRIGIASSKRGSSDLRDFVLSKFSADEKKTVKAIIARAAAAIETWVKKGVAAAMNEFNTDGGGGN